jgi:hypothetical protein
MKAERTPLRKTGRETRRRTNLVFFDKARTAKVRIPQQALAVLTCTA